MTNESLTRSMPGTTRAIQAIREIPKAKRKRKTTQTLAGVLVIAGTIALRVKVAPDIPWYVLVGGCVLGGVMISKELFVMSLHVVANAVAELVKAASGKSGDTGEQQTEHDTPRES